MIHPGLPLAAGLSLLAASAAAQTVELTVPVSGVVEVVWVKPGQRVAAGTPLLRLDETALRAQLDEAEARLAQAETDAADAARDFGRARELHERLVTALSEFEAAQSRHARAGAQLRLAQAQRARAAHALASATLRAPAAGRVVAVPGQPGVVVTAECQPRTLVVFEAAP